MGRQKTGRPRGRPRTVAANEATEAEHQFLGHVAAYQVSHQKAPTLAEIARRGTWSRQRASQLCKRLEQKGLVSRTEAGGVATSWPAAATGGEDQ